MEATSLIQATIALLFVLGLIGLVNLALKRYGLEKLLYALQKKGEGKRLSVEETLVLDARRRLVLVKCDKTEHLILLGATTEQVIAKLSTQKTNA
jgi:flagellar protein FliO/FliZ